MIRDEIIDWFIEHSHVSKDVLSEKENKNIFEEGLLDSFGFLQLISYCEKELDIRFGSDVFDDDESFTIGGFIAAAEKESEK